MASLEECEQAFADLAARLAADPGARGKGTLDRSVTCQVTDLDVVFGAQLRDGGLHDVALVDESDGQIKLTMASDELVALLGGKLNVLSALTSGQVKIDASMMDMLKLRSAF